MDGNLAMANQLEQPDWVHRQRVIFVGVHNKPGMLELDSKTRTGKLVDRVINWLQYELNLSGFIFIKSNLFDIEYWPKNQTFVLNNQWVEHWKDRVNYSSNDIIITLGHTVNEIFRKAKVKSIKLGHPSAVWSKEKQEDYILNAAIKFSEYSNNER